MSIHNRQDRYLPVRPNLDQLKHQAKDLLREIRRGDPSAIEEFKKYHPKPVPSDNVKLADAQLALARSYKHRAGRGGQCCELIDANLRDDVDAVRELVVRTPTCCTRTPHCNSMGVRR